MRPMLGGLGGNKDSEEAAIEARSESSKWVEVLDEGKARKKCPQAGRRKAGKCPAIFSHLIFGLISRTPPIVGECSFESTANCCDRTRQASERHNGIVVAVGISMAERVGLHYLSELLHRDFRATHLSETTQK